MGGTRFVHVAALPTSALAAVAAPRTVTLKHGESLLIVGATGSVTGLVVGIGADCPDSASRDTPNAASMLP
jgi:NADPH:quinone reductase-like Zn-dependent oxidoreductase